MYYSKNSVTFLYYSLGLTRNTYLVKANPAKQNLLNIKIKTLKGLIGLILDFI